jgi:DNA-binding CsgD family transcriptional regulator
MAAHQTYRPTAGKLQPHPILHEAVRRLGLTPRQSDIVELLALGHTTEDVIDELGIRGTTLRSHLTAIFAKLPADSRTEVVSLVLRELLTLTPVELSKARTFDNAPASHPGSIQRQDPR